jgi:hypothetical protein
MGAASPSRRRPPLPAGRVGWMIELVAWARPLARISHECRRYRHTLTHTVWAAPHRWIHVQDRRTGPDLKIHSPAVPPNLPSSSSYSTRTPPASRSTPTSPFPALNVPHQHHTHPAVGCVRACCCFCTGKRQPPDGSDLVAGGTRCCGGLLARSDPDPLAPLVTRDY